MPKSILEIRSGVAVQSSFVVPALRKSKAFTKDVRLQAKEESKTPVDIETQVKQLVQQHGRLHAKTLTFMNHQALAYRDMDKNEDALQVYREVHDGCKQTLGMQHPYTLASISNLANILFEMDRLQEARPLLEEALERQSEMLGSRHLDTLQTAHSLALLLEEQGEFHKGYCFDLPAGTMAHGMRKLPCGLVAPVFVMAPMVKQSERPFRAMVRSHGCSLCYTEMFMADEFAASAEYRRRALADGVDDADHPLFLQFAANDPQVLLQAALAAQELGADGVDLNLGCPQRRAREGRYGAWLANDEHEWPMIAEMISACSRCADLRIPVCCKIRLQHTLAGTIKFAKLLQEAGCPLLAIHGRKLLCSKSKHREGAADLAAIAAVRDALQIPVFTNGNVRSPADIFQNLKATQCEGIMCAEQLLNDPALFRRALDWRPGFPCPGPSSEMLVDEYLGLCCEYGAEDETVSFSVWGATNGHVIREHVHRMRSLKGPDAYLSLPGRKRCLEQTDAAEPLYIRAYEGQKSALGPKNPTVLQTGVNLAGLKQVLGKLQEAEDLDREVMAGCRELLGDRDVQMLQSGNSLARLLHEQGMLKEAEGLLQEVLQGRIELLGDRDPATLTSLNNLGGLYYTWGRFGEAEPHFFSALEGRRAVLGLLHPDTLQSANNLASLFQARGRLDKAEPLFRESLDGRREVLGVKHPDTLTSCSNLAVLLHAMNQLQEAEELMKDALEGRREVLGDHHRDTLTSINNLAGLMRSRGKHVDAELLYQEALTGRKKLLGDTHVDTLMTANNYGLCLLNRGLLKEAESIFVEVLKNCRNTLGVKHSYTLTCANSLGGLLHEAERYDEAEPLFREVLSGLRSQLGDKHPDSLTGANNLAVLLFAKDEYAKAVELFQEVLAGRRSQLGDKHPDTVQAARHMAAAQQAQRHLMEDQSAPTGSWCGSSHWSLVCCADHS
ncbi:tRNA-dihydrouridine(16/17) synthase [NAD(P)(+)]-like [Symbiodinium microadriaticum]|uniref:tRNA-dihydrouridine(16/17) synthase [NAD(P)(+)]-like n=1 Tax=Symbiodinium microadriaticum TaxID=2951 RepID=A0A1Q9CM24_SYMMI|nr:tRNA-dihydrouridine(16/17) synthase [NAD(P)(+)]-like [Symbiodinium microadriaticum]